LIAAIGSVWFSITTTVTPFLSLLRLAVGGVNAGSAPGAGGWVQSAIPDLSNGAGPVGEVGEEAAALGGAAVGAAAGPVGADAGAAAGSTAAGAAAPPPPHAAAAPMTAITAIAATVLLRVMAPPAASRPA
jgi:hypothetical protein